ncbi:MAG: plasmid pRiA4b ORF-3 family protein [Chloroflexota bacterium]
MPAPKKIYQIKVTLRDSKPPIWRRLLLSEETSLATLHKVIQIAMGWEDYHLHMFEIAGQSYGVPEDDEFGDFDVKDETRHRLGQMNLPEKAKFSYEYDFGDSWAHTILVEKILPADSPAGSAGFHYPTCTAGKRACPPEDVGGIWGYEEFLQAIADPGHEEHEDMLAWIGGEFDPEAFDIEQVNASLRMMNPKTGRDRKRAEPEADDSMPSADEEALESWFSNLNPEQRQTLEMLPLRRDMLAFLDYLAKNRTVGTQSTGNLPLKAVREICKRFTHPPVLEETINGHTYKVRSEDEVWPLMFVHQLAFHALLVTGGQSKTWKVTSEGQSFTKIPPPIQVFFLFMHWWVSVDWTIAFPVSGLANGLPDQFVPEALAALETLPVGKDSPYAPFADRIIAGSGLKWPAPDQTFVQTILHSAVERLVVGPMVSFGVLQGEYGTKKVGGATFRDLKSIRLTSIGEDLLGLLK